MQKNKPLLIVIILIVLALLIFFFYDSDKNQIIPEQTFNIATETETSTSDTEDANTEASVTQDMVTIEYTKEGFSPKTVTIGVGETVRFINNDSRDMWIASALHPTHQALPGFDQLEAVELGSVYEFTFTKAGSWKYHNHVQASHTGSITVTEG